PVLPEPHDHSGGGAGHRPACRDDLLLGCRPAHRRNPAGCQSVTDSLGTSAMLFPAALFVVSYGVIMTERVNRAVVVILAAGIAIALGFLTQSEAVSAIDFNTLALLIG